MYINNEEIKYWLMNKFEEISVGSLNVSKERKVKILKYLTKI